VTSEPPEGSGEFADFFHTDELPTGPLPRQSHRRENQRRLLESRLVAPLTAVSVVVVVILLLIWINGKPSGNGPGPGVVSAPKTSTTPAVSHPPASQSAAPSHTAVPTRSTAATPTSAPTTAPTHAAVPVDLNAMASVKVLNNSTVSGLAARVANELRGKHWKITSVGNLQGVVPETTVYYPAGERAAAKHLAREFTSIRRVAPATSASLGSHGRGLTLVVTRDWSG
jgi:hypothetical protein